MTINDQPDIDTEETQHLAGYDLTRQQHRILNQFYRARVNDDRRHKDGEIDHGGWRCISDFQDKPDWQEVINLIEMGLLEWAGFIRVTEAGSNCAYAPWRDYPRCGRIEALLEQSYPDTVFSVWSTNDKYHIDYDEKGHNAPSHRQVFEVVGQLAIPPEHCYLNIPF